MDTLSPFLLPVCSTVGGAATLGLGFAFVILQWKRPDPEKVRQLWLKFGILLGIVAVLIISSAFGWMGLLPMTLLLAYLGWQELWHRVVLSNHEVLTAADDAAATPVDMQFPPVFCAGLGMLGVSTGLSGNETVILCGNLAMMWLAIALPLLRWRRPMPMQHGLTIALGTLVISLPLALLLALGSQTEGIYLFLVLIVMGHDGFSEAFGRLGGRIPLCPEISPNKTWEGTVGGWLSSLVLGGLLRFLVPHWQLWQVLSVAALIAILALLGDLSFSAWKRSLGIKDFSQRLAVTGGILDKFDGLLCAAPMVYAVAQWLGP